jgi:Ran GTPase-activating protein (RanGAP) involved in mRNA processing and transport
MSVNHEDFSDEEDSDAGGYYEGFAHHDNAGRAASSMARVIAQLRTNDPFLFPGASSNHHFGICPSVSDHIRVNVAEALIQNTIVQRILLRPHDYSKLSADAMAKYLLQSKHLLHVDLRLDVNYIMEHPHQHFLSTFIEAIGQSTSVQQLSLMNMGLGTTSESFATMLTRTKTLRRLRVDLERQDPLEEAATTAIASGFSKNSTLRDIKLVDWQQSSLTPALTALRDHTVLEKLQVEGFSSFTGIDALLRGEKSRLKELIIARFKGSTVEQMVYFESFMLEMGRNTTILKIVIAAVPLSCDNIQQLKAMLRRNTVLQDLNLTGDTLGSAGLAEIASALYRNTSIQGFDISDNGLDGLVAANALRELLRRNKTITRLCMDHNAFGSNVVAIRCIADGFRANTTLQELDLSYCGLDDQGLSILAESLGQQKRCLVKLNVSANLITCNGLRALVDNATAALSTVTHLNLSNNFAVCDEGASFLAETLRRQTLPSLKCLQLDACGIFDVGLVGLMSALEENETLDVLNLENNALQYSAFSVQGYMALASSLPNIKGLQQIDFSLTTSDLSVMPALLKGFRENTSLHEVNIAGGVHGKYWSQELSFLLYRNKFRRLLQYSDTDDRASLGLWSHALGSVATRPDVLFHVLTSKAGLIRATPDEDSKKRKRDDSE